MMSSEESGSSRDVTNRSPAILFFQPHIISAVNGKFCRYAVVRNEIMKKIMNRGWRVLTNTHHIRNNYTVNDADNEFPNFRVISIVGKRPEIETMERILELAAEGLTQPVETFLHTEPATSSIENYATFTPNQPHHVNMVRSSNSQTSLSMKIENMTNVRIHSTDIDLKPSFVIEGTDCFSVKRALFLIKGICSIIEKVSINRINARLREGKEKEVGSGATTNVQSLWHIPNLQNFANASPSASAFQNATVKKPLNQVNEGGLEECENVEWVFANSQATVSPNNSPLVSAKTRIYNPTEFSANNIATVPPNNFLLDPAKARTKNPTGISANNSTGISANNPTGISANNPTGISANNPTGISANNPTGISANNPTGISANNSTGISANNPATVPHNSSLLVSAKTVTHNFHMVSATAPVKDTPANPALPSKTKYSFEGESSKDSNSQEFLEEIIDTFGTEQERSEINSKKDSKKRKYTMDSQLTLDLEIRRKKSDNKEKISAKQRRPNQDIQLNSTLPEQPDFFNITTITIPSPKYYCDENICENNSSYQSEVTTSVPFLIAPTANTDISACSSIQINDKTNIPDLQRPEMVIEPLPPLPFPSEGTNYLWEEENLSHRFPLKCTKDGSFETCDLVDQIHHCYVDLQGNVTFREVYDADGNGTVQIWHSSNNSILLN